MVSILLYISVITKLQFHLKRNIVKLGPNNEGKADNKSLEYGNIVNTVKRASKDCEITRRLLFWEWGGYFIDPKAVVTT